MVRIQCSVFTVICKWEHSVLFVFLILALLYVVCPSEEIIISSIKDCIRNRIVPPLHHCLGRIIFHLGLFKEMCIYKQI